MDTIGMINLGFACIITVLVVFLAVVTRDLRRAIKADKEFTKWYKENKK